jgi:hypothetical protein
MFYEGTHTVTEKRLRPAHTHDSSDVSFLNESYVLFPMSFMPVS